MCQAMYICTQGVKQCSTRLNDSFVRNVTLTTAFIHTENYCDDKEDGEKHFDQVLIHLEAFSIKTPL